VRAPFDATALAARLGLGERLVFPARVRRARGAPRGATPWAYHAIRRTRVVKETIDSSGVPIRVGEPTGHQLEPLVMQQARQVAGLPITEAVCLMPDAHFGIGGPVGGVIATRGAVVPALVGVDIGCGMIATRTDLPASMLEGRHAAVRAAIEAGVPVGGPGVKGSSMGARSFIVRGRGNSASYESCSHGAGRRMSRGEARRVFSLEDHARATAGIECRKDAGVLDETPGAYKDIDAVMAAQSDLVEVVTALRQVVTVKG
jgi:RNA-splicing ligase RtcB